MARSFLALVPALVLGALALPAHADGCVSFGFGGPVARRPAPPTAPNVCSLGCCTPVLAQPAVQTTTYVATPAVKTHVVQRVQAAPTTRRVVRRVVETRPGWYDPPWSYRPVAGRCAEDVVTETTYEVVAERPAYRVRYVYGSGCGYCCASPCYGGCGWPCGSACAYPCAGGCGWGCGWGYPVAWGLGLGLGLGLAGCW